MNILLIEDDDPVAASLVLALGGGGYRVDRFSRASDAEISAVTEPYDIIILDLGLPGMDGLEFLRSIRTKKVAAPVLILTARDSFEERIEGLDSGANDYVTKPFHLGELEARIRALLRAGCSNVTTVELGQLTFDLVGRVLRKGDQIIDLSPPEYALLEILVHNLGSLVTKQKLSALLSDWEAPVTYNSMDIVVHRLRKKLEPFGLKLLTIRGLGFLVEP